MDSKNIHYFYFILSLNIDLKKNTFFNRESYSVDVSLIDLRLKEGKTTFHKNLSVYCLANYV